MANGMSQYLGNKLIDFLFRANTGSFSAPTNLWIGLTTASVSDTDTGSTVSEVSSSGTAYGRQQLNSGTTNWTACQGGTVGASSGPGGTTTNAVAITFDQATSDWTTVTSMFIADASTGGNILYWADLSTPKPITTGDTFSFAVTGGVGALSVQFVD